MKQGWMPGLRAALAAPISPYSLAVLRMLFGAILLWDCWRYIDGDRIRRYYVDVEMTFPYFGWDWIQPLPPPWIHVAWLLVGFASFLIMIGLFTRAATIGFILLFGYFFLLDRTQYLNHNYMVLLYAVLLAMVPANRALSVDAWLWPRLRADQIAAWPVAAVRLQTEIILIYAGLVKITDDWLRGEPLRSWLSGREDAIWFGALFQYDWAFIAAAWGTIFLHVLGAPLLLWHKTRLAVFVVYAVFHVSNAILFNIGIFPWITIAVTTIFFAPDWPRVLVRRLASAFRLTVVDDAAPMAPTRTGSINSVLLATLAVWFVVQLLLPLRQGLFPNLVGWTGDGHRFSWRMRIYDRDGDGWFEIVSADGSQRWRVEPEEFLTDRQEAAVLSRPDLVHDFAGKLRDEWARRGHAGVAVYAHIEMSLNGRPHQPFIDSTVDLATAKFNWLAPDPWVLPLKVRAAEGIVPDWFPPLPLQRP